MTARDALEQNVREGGESPWKWPGQGERNLPSQYLGF